MWVWFESGCCFFLCLCTFLKPVLSIFCLSSALAIFLVCGFLWPWPEDPKIISQCYGNPILCCWIPYFAKMSTDFFLCILYEKRPVSVPPGPCESLALPFKFIILPLISAAFPAWRSIFFHAQAHAWGLFPGFDLGYLVLWGLVKKRLELEGKNAHNSLEETREGLYFVCLFLLNCLLIYALFSAFSPMYSAISMSPCIAVVPVQFMMTVDWLVGDSHC